MLLDYAEEEKENVKGFTKLIEELKESAFSLEKSLGEKTKECEALQDSLKTHEKESNETLQRTKKEFEDRAEQQLERALKDKEEEFEAISKKFEEKDEVIRRLSQKEDQSIPANNLGTKISELTAVIDSLKEHLNQKEEVIAQMRHKEIFGREQIEENTRLRENVKAEEMKTAELSGKIRQLQFELEGARVKYDALQSNYDDLVRRRNSLESDLNLVSFIGQLEM